MRSNLAPIGIIVEIVEISGLGYDPLPPDADVDLYGVGIDVQHADPADFLYVMLFWRMPPEWLPEGVADQVDALFELTGRSNERQP